MRVYYDRDADVNLIKGKKVLVVGYGSQGHAHAHESARQRRQGRARRAAPRLRLGARRRRPPGFKVMAPADGAKWADVVMMLTPDELQAELYANDLKPNMRPDTALAFAHGFNIHFKLIEPRPDMDVFMIAPKGRATPCARNIVTRRRRALPGRGRAEPVGQRARDRAVLRLGDRRRHAPA